ncbi:hypothetical protein QAD02_000714 [Eretmocerus hayati]|uniref:Uncharacterized protein n=1 Tax=Eretmocerus hayati TaxID=131215 RepID=A0ACC2NE61_9HYME|nr:hypothetical protein QAD02_000714 [Eretmocerus hayati]
MTSKPVPRWPGVACISQHYVDVEVRAQRARAPRIDQRQRSRSPVRRNRHVIPPSPVTRNQKQPRLRSPVVNNGFAPPRTRTTQAVEDRHRRQHRSPGESDHDTSSLKRGRRHRRTSSSPPAREHRHRRQHSPARNCECASHRSADRTRRLYHRRRSRSRLPL